jgi:Spy/CpxP family protein refolding chaperone
MARHMARTTRLVRWTLAIVAWSVLASLVWAQPDGERERGRGRGRGMMGPDLVGLALQKSVSEELKLTSDQIDRLKQLPEPERRGRGENAEERQKSRLEAFQAREKKVAEILEPGQLTRLKQINYQVMGPRAFMLPPVGEALNLTGEEKEKIQSAAEKGFREFGRLMESGAIKEGDSEEIKEANRTEFAKVDAATMEKIMAVLTPEQQSKWKEMLGEPFKGKVDRPGAGGRRGFGRRGSDDKPSGKDEQ